MKLIDFKKVVDRAAVVYDKEHAEKEKNMTSDQITGTRLGLVVAVLVDEVNLRLAALGGWER